MIEDPETCQAVTLTRAFDEELTLKDCLQRIAVARNKICKAEEEDTFCDWDMEWLEDTCLAKDAKGAKELFAKCTKNDEEKLNAVAEKIRFVHKVFKTEYTGPRPKVKKSQAAKKKAERHYADLERGADKKLKELTPSPAHFRILTDADNGRWRVLFRPFGKGESVSWSEIGAVADAIVLKWMYDQMFEYNGTPMPWDVIILSEDAGISVAP